ncbi:MAG: 50S ribosomal protein L11 methyltransferase [Sandaracinaceae bacterium]
MSEPRYPYVHVAVTAAEVEIVSHLLWEAGASGVEERDGSTMTSTDGVELVASFETDASANACVKALSEQWTARVEHVVGDAWRDGWKAFFKPTRIGARLLVVPPWETAAAKPDDLVIVLDPGQAFGTGTHETTRLVLAEIEQRVKGGETVLDVGCGSGILGIAALRLGAASVHAVDIDPIAVRTALENAEVNGVRLTASDEPIEEVEGTYLFVLANIRTPVLIPMADALVARVDGTLVLSGILASEEAEVRGAYDARLVYVGRREDGDWIALTYAVAAA